MGLGTSTAFGMRMRYIHLQHILSSMQGLLGLYPWLKNREGLGIEVGWTRLKVGTAFGPHHGWAISDQVWLGLIRVDLT